VSIGLEHYRHTNDPNKKHRTDPNEIQGLGVDTAAERINRVGLIAFLAHLIDFSMFYGIVEELGDFPQSVLDSIT
jgi:hypothetical protein